MRFNLARAHQRYLPLLGQRCIQTAQEVVALETVHIEYAAKVVLIDALSMQGAQHSGPLFGRRLDDTLSVEYACSAGYGADVVNHPLALDARYLLGLTDAYRQCDEALDWVGHWISWSDRRMPDEQELLRWFKVARDAQLVSDEHILLMVGWVEGQLIALSCVVGEEPTDCEWLSTALL